MKNSKRFGAKIPKTRSAVSRAVESQQTDLPITGAGDSISYLMPWSFGSPSADPAITDYMPLQHGAGPWGFCRRSVVGTHSRVPNALPIALTLLAVATTFLIGIILINL
jgi:hypothetical protein